MINITGLDHVVLRVNDPGVMIAFYRDVLGCAVEREAPKARLTQMRAGAALIDLIWSTGEEPSAAKVHRNLDHFCLRIDPFDEAAIRRHLQRHDTAPGPVVDRYGAEGDGPSMYIEDPEGNTVELKGPPY